MYACVQHDSPMRGPNTGPTRVDISRIPMARPRLFGGKTSAIEPMPAPLQTGADVTAHIQWQQEHCYCRQPTVSPTAALQVEGPASTTTSRLKILRMPTSIQNLKSNGQRDHSECTTCLMMATLYWQHNALHQTDGSSHKICTMLCSAKVTN